MGCGDSCDMGGHGDSHDVVGHRGIGTWEWMEGTPREGRGHRVGGHRSRRDTPVTERCGWMQGGTGGPQGRGGDRRGHWGTQGDILEALRSEEVEEVEELLQVVLQRGPRQQQLVFDLVPIQHPKELGGGVGRHPWTPASGIDPPLIPPMDPSIWE